MDKYFIFGLGIIVLFLHVPGMIIPRQHRELGFRFMQKALNLRLIGILMAGIGAAGVLVAPGSGVKHWFLLLFGIYMILSGLFLLSAPDKFVQKSQKLFSSSSLGLWIGRAVVKSGLGLALAIWGAVLIFA